jgi:hypothetical protein
MLMALTLPLPLRNAAATKSKVASDGLATLPQVFCFDA